MSQVKTSPTINDLLTEKLKPKNFDQIILSDRLRKALNNGDIKQHMLFYGTQGTGKTSTAKVMAMVAMGHHDYYINCSDETGVDVIRDKITMMCTSVSVLDGEYAKKVIILDEIEGVSDQFFKALRGTMDKFPNCRFIATTNYLNKVPEPIQSRFECVNFDPITVEEEIFVKDEWIKRLKMLLSKLAIDADDEAINELIRRNFPDMRSTLNKIQNIHHQGVQVLTAENIRNLGWDFQDLYEMVMQKPDPYKNYEFVMANYASKVDDVLNALGAEFVGWLRTNHKDKDKLVPQLLVAVADYQSKRHLVIDPVVSLLACIFTIQKIFNS